MRKFVVFSVGGALCSFLEIDGQTFIIDAGAGNDFNPALEFMVPYFERSKKAKIEDGKYILDQLIVSHPHKDHISCLPDVLEGFYPRLITCPNDKDVKDNEEYAIDWDEFFPTDKKRALEDPCVVAYREMYKDRSLPLRKALRRQTGNSQYLYQLSSERIKGDDEMLCESYANNLSLVTYFTINGYHILFPGDIMKCGFKNLLDAKEIDGSHTLRGGLGKGGIDILIAPHHGLKSAFSAEMFEALPENKVRCLNIISEKVGNPDDGRDVDSRYSSKEYCAGENNLDTKNGVEQNYSRKSSQGHICVDLSQSGMPDIRIYQDVEDVLKWFCRE